MGVLVCPLSNDFLLPKTAPIPILSVFNAGPPNGSITFDQDLDQSVPLTGADFERGFGAVVRQAVTISYSGPRTILIADMSAADFTATPVGWKYTPNVNRIKGTSGIEVVAFEAFTTGE